MPATIGYYTGILDVYYATLSTEDSAAAAPTYGTPAVLGKSIEVTLTPRFKEGSLYASNKRVRHVNRITGYDVSINVDQLTSAVKEALLGRTQIGSTGVYALTDDADAPEVAIGFAITKDNGSKECWWLLKGKFSEGEVTASTEEDGIEYQTPTIEGAFDARIYDGRIAYVADGDDAAAATAIASWFTAVPEPAGDDDDEDDDETNLNGDTQNGDTQNGGGT